MTRYEVTAHGFRDQLVALVRGFRDRAEAEAEATRLFARDDVNRVRVTVQVEPEGNGRYR